MTAPSLPETLRALSHAFPHRFTRLENWPESWWAVWYEDPDEPEERGFLSLGRDDKPNLARLEYALREEIEARGWTWNAESTISHSLGHYFATVHAPSTAHDGGAFADSPAHALALALLRALERGN